jgi:hypothetical protein
MQCFVYIVISFTTVGLYLQLQFALSEYQPQRGMQVTKNINGKYIRIRIY